MFVEGVMAEAKDAGGVVNITKWIDHLAFDVIRCYKDALNVYRSVEHCHWVRTLKRWKPLKVMI